MELECDLDIDELREEYNNLYLQGRLRTAPSFDELERRQLDEESCSGQFCVLHRVIGWIAVALTLSLLFYPYIVLYTHTLFPLLFSPPPSLPLYGVVGVGVLVGAESLLLFLVLWSYFCTILTPPGTIPFWFVVSQTILGASPPIPSRRSRSGSEAGEVGGASETEKKASSGVEVEMEEVTGNTEEEGDDDVLVELEDAEKQQPPLPDADFQLDSFESFSLLGNELEKVTGEIAEEEKEAKGDKDKRKDEEEGGGPKSGKIRGTVQTKAGGGVRKCKKCSKPKPDRAHHCSICGRCVLKMDHHCPWVNNCVGWGNYKFFFLFVSYVVLYAILTAFVSFFILILGPSWESFTIWEYHTIVILLISSLLSLLLSSFWSTHYQLLSSNLSTIENVEKKNPIRSSALNPYPPPKPRRRRDSDCDSQNDDASPSSDTPPPPHRSPPGTPPRDSPNYHHFDLGVQRNFESVFGEGNAISWVLPIWTTSGDGVHFETAV